MIILSPIVNKIFDSSKTQNDQKTVVVPILSSRRYPTPSHHPRRGSIAFWSEPLGIGFLAPDFVQSPGGLPVEQISLALLMFSESTRRRNHQAQAEEWSKFLVHIEQLKEDSVGYNL